MMIKKYLTALSFVAVVLATGFASCKKYVDPPPVFEVGDSLVVKPARKVLLIGVDGLPGAVIKEIMPATISSILPRSKYSWDAVSSSTTTTVSAWKTLLSGVNSTTHNVLGYDSTFSLVVGGQDYEHQYIPYYPSFFNYILTSPQNDLRTTFITAWEDLPRYAAPEVTSRVIASSDAVIKDSAVAVLKRDNNDMVVVNFSSPARAGIASGFSITSTEFKNAVTTVDGYIGDLINTIKARPQYDKNEEWLIIITGTHGGKNNGFGGGSDEEMLVPLIFYNPRFAKTEFTKAGAYTNVRIFGRTESGDYTVGTLKGEDIYNPGINEQTVQLKIKGSGAFYPHFLSKTTRRWDQPGWSLFSAGSDWSLYVKSATSGQQRLGGSTGGAPRTVLDNQWHTITFVFADSASRWWARLFTDGKRSGQHDITGLRTSGGITSPAPIRIGYGADPDFGGLDFRIADFAIFNKALTDAEISTNICLKDMKQHPRYANLIGYWPGSDGIGNTFRNLAPGAEGKDFVLTGKYGWVTDPLVPCTIPTVAPSGQKIMMTRTADISSQILYWFRIEDWKKEGTRWLNEYELEFIK